VLAFASSRASRTVRLLEFYAEIYYQTEIVPLNRYHNLEFRKFKVINQDKMTLYCEPGEQICDSKIFVFYPGIVFDDYLVRITVLDDQLVNNTIERFEFTMLTHASDYIAFLICIRYTCLLLSVIGFVFYVQFFTKISPEVITFEHQFIMILSLGLVFFNDPLYALTLILPSVTFTFFSTIVVTAFIAMLVFFWILMFERITEEPLSPNTKLVSPLKVLCACVLFVLLTISGLTATIMTRFDPSMHAYEELLNKISRGLR